MASALYILFAILLLVIETNSYTSVINTWSDDWQFNVNGNNGWSNPGYCGNSGCRPDNPVIKVNGVNKYHGSYYSWGADGINPQHTLSQEFYCRYDSDVTISYKYATCKADSTDYYYFYFNDVLIESKDGNSPNTKVNDATLNKACDEGPGDNEGFKYISKSFAVGSVKSGELFEPKWVFIMNAFDHFVVWDIKINCDGTANPTKNPTNRPTNEPTLLPSLNPSQLPTQTTTNPTQFPTLFQKPENTLSVDSKTGNTKDNEVEAKEYGTTETENGDIKNELNDNSNDSFPEWMIIALIACAIFICFALCLVVCKTCQKQKRVKDTTHSTDHLRAHSVVSVSEVEGERIQTTQVMLSKADLSTEQSLDTDIAHITAGFEKEVEELDNVNNNIQNGDEDVIDHVDKMMKQTPLGKNDELDDFVVVDDEDVVDTVNGMIKTTQKDDNFRKDEVDEIQNENNNDEEIINDINKTTQKMSDDNGLDALDDIDSNVHQDVDVVDDVDDMMVTIGHKLTVNDEGDFEDDDDEELFSDGDEDEELLNETNTKTIKVE